MHDLILRFLLESGFPRGSILTDHLTDESLQGYQPAFLIVDPDSADTLAVIDVDDTGTLEKLSSVALHAGRYAARAGQDGVQSFVIQVDSNNPDESEQVRFFKLLAGKKMQQISSYAFPDLDTLRVARKLKQKKKQQSELLDLTLPESGTAGRDKNSPVLYGLVFFLLLVGIADWALLHIRGSGIFTLQQILLLISAATLLALLILSRQIRRQS